MGTDSFFQQKAGVTYFKSQKLSKNNRLAISLLMIERNNILNAFIVFLWRFFFVLIAQKGNLSL